ncbi:otoancorin [Thamnophis elegans]|uniref:otoancorin n=1 Tax=Thamnophis elegans TaxID=35005 RepID=UPI001378CDBF|nr:otoancorin [Thamnophis elegans]
MESGNPSNESQDLPPQLQRTMEDIITGQYLNALLNILNFQSSSIWTKDLFNQIMTHCHAQNFPITYGSLQVESISSYFEHLFHNPRRLLSIFRDMSPEDFQAAMKYLFGRTQKYLDLGNILIDLHGIRKRLFQSPGGNRTLVLITLEKCFGLLNSAECVDILRQILQASSATYLQAHNVASFPQDLQKEAFRNLSTVFKDLYDRLTTSSQRAVYEWMMQNLQTFDNTSDNSMSWVSAENLWILGRYMVHLPLEEIQKINPYEMWLFASYDNATKQLDMVYDITPDLARAFLERINASGFDMRNISTLYRLGLLVCFYHDLAEMDSTMARALLHQMIKCHQLRSFQANVQKLKAQLLNVAVQNQTLNDVLGTLSDAVVGLATSQLESLSPTAVHAAISTLNQVSRWAKSQTIILSSKYLLYEKALSFHNVSQMGALAPGIDTPSFYNMNPSELSQAIPSVLAHRALDLSPAQRQGIFRKILASVPLTSVLTDLPSAFFTEVSLFDLWKAGSFNASLVGGKELRASQALFLYDLLSRKTSLSDLLSHGQLLKGLTCRHIENLSPISFLNLFHIFEKHLRLLSSFQVNCLAWKFWTISEASVPAYLLAVLPAEFLESVAGSRCVPFLISLGKAGLDHLVWSEQKKGVLLQKIQRCLEGSVADEYTVDLLGNLLCHLSPTFICRGVSPEVMTVILHRYSQCPHLSYEQKMEVQQKLIALHGSPTNWTVETIKDHGAFMVLLPKDDLIALLEKFPDFVSEVASKTSQRLSAPKQFLLAQFESLYASRIRIQTSNSTPDCEDVAAPSSDEIIQLSEANMFWSIQELNCMESGTFSQTVEILGQVRNFNTSQLAVLKEKAKQAWGPPEHWKRYHIVSLGCIVTALNEKEIEMLDLSLIDTVSALTQQTAWDPSQAKSILQGFLDDSGQEIASLKSFDLVALDATLCTLNATEVASINATEFSVVLARLSSLPCSTRTLGEFKKKVESVFGSPTKWNPAILQEIGTIAAGLNEKELRALDHELMAYFQPAAIASIPSDIFKELSPEQLANLGPENAARTTDSQRQHLSERQFQSLQLALDGGRRRIREVSLNESTIDPTSGPLLNAKTAVERHAQRFINSSSSAQLR